MKEQRKSGIVTAFYSAYFSRLEKLSGSDLEKVLENIDKEQGAEMSDEAMLAFVKRIAQVGGESHQYNP